MLKVTSKENGKERIDYIFNGVITYAKDKHYATVIQTKDNDTVLEQYFDEKGKPEQQPSGHYALLKEYDGDNHNCKTTYLGINLEPILNTSGYSSWVRTYNERGYTKKESYYDIEGSLVETIGEYYGRQFSYEGNRNTGITYTDQSGAPVMTESGYAILKRTFYLNGKVENEFYYDTEDQPVALKNGEYGVHREYDEKGRTSVITYLDIAGEPMTTRAGYATIRKTYFQDPKVQVDMYYDSDGNPAALAKGQYGVLRDGSKTTLLNKEGKPYFHLGKFLYENPLSVMILGLLVVFCSTILSRKGNICLLVLYLLFIIFMTLMEREEGDMRANLEILWSYKDFLSSQSMRMEILNNIWLFVPLGGILYNLSGEPKSLIIPILLSVIIEVTQYFTGLGLAEIDDVISNGIGGLIGSCLSVILNSKTSLHNGHLLNRFHHLCTNPDCNDYTNN